MICPEQLPFYHGELDPLVTRDREWDALGRRRRRRSLADRESPRKIRRVTT
jgi:hypothetical protein